MNNNNDKHHLGCAFTVMLPFACTECGADSSDNFILKPIRGKNYVLTFEVLCKLCETKYYINVRIKREMLNVPSCEIGL